MFENVSVNTQSSIRIEHEGAVVYIDPWKIENAAADADVICLTHNHFDHLSPEDIKKVSHPGTLVLAPYSMEDELNEKLAELTDDNFEFLEPGDEIEIDDIRIEAVAAYNTNKEFHKKEYGWLGYIIELGGVKYYASGDTDVTEEIKEVKCDVAMVPIGGVYTMDMDEAAAYINELAPKYVIPIHFGVVEGVGAIGDDEIFAGKINKETEVVYKLHR